jgi:drug/metabolite transporter (DMT)-like permease
MVSRMRRVVLLALIWGWSFVFIKVAVGGMTPFTVAAVRMTLGCLALLAIGRHTGVRLPGGRTYWRHMAFIGITGCAVPFTLLAWGEEHITSALTSVAQGTTSLFTALFAAVLVREHLKPVQVLGLLTGLIGVAVAAGLAAGDLTGASVVGVGAAVAAGASYGLTYTYTQRYLGGVAPMAAATGQLLVGALFLAPFAVGSSLVSGLELSPSRVAAIFTLGVVGTGIAYWINFGTIATVGATAASLVTYLIPPVAVVVGWAVLGEDIQPRLVLGLAIIVASVAAVRSGGARVRPPAARPARYTSRA